MATLWIESHRQATSIPGKLYHKAGNIVKPVHGTIQYAIEAYEKEMRRARLEAMLTKP